MAAGCRREEQEPLLARRDSHALRLVCRLCLELERKHRAEAAKDGGFMGFGAQQVSDREQAMVDRVRETVGG